MTSRAWPAEVVLPGHPDKLADAIADGLVAEAMRRDDRALVGVEVALHRDVVFVDGRIACADAAAIDVEAVVREVYRSAGYGALFPPDPESLDVKIDLDLGPLLPGEAEFREVSDDQVIVVGYANDVAGAGHLPVEHATALRIGRALERLRIEVPEIGLGPDGKALVVVEEVDAELRVAEVSVSVQHRQDRDDVAILRAVRAVVASVIEQSAALVAGFAPRSDPPLIVNGAGEFVVGGPFGDNGLSGKKLVMDFYGPRVPIGGGALSGKDLWKADRAGALHARRLALRIVEEMTTGEATVTLGIRPGDRTFELLRIDGPNCTSIDPAPWIACSQLTLASAHDLLRGRRLIDVARYGHFTDLLRVEPAA